MPIQWDRFGDLFGARRDTKAKSIYVTTYRSRTNIVGIYYATCSCYILNVHIQSTAKLSLNYNLDSHHPPILSTRKFDLSPFVSTGIGSMKSRLAKFLTKLMVWLRLGMTAQALRTPIIMIIILHPWYWGLFVEWCYQTLECPEFELYDSSSFLFLLPHPMA